MKDRRRIILYVVMGLVVVLVIAVEGVTNLITAWNVLPVLLAAIVVHRASGKPDPAGSSRQRVSGGVCSFAVAVAAVVGLGHLAWLFDWGGTATGASTSALLFVVLPLVALVVGAAAWGIAAVMGRHMD